MVAYLIDQILQHVSVTKFQNNRKCMCQKNISTKREMKVSEGHVDIKCNWPKENS